MSDRISVELDTTTVANNLQNLSPRVKQGLTTLGDATGQRMKAYAQNTARWTDRTGDARNHLDYSCSWEGAVMDIAIFHKMPYGVYLEERNSQKYAILQEARDNFVAEFTRAVRNMNL